MMRNNMMPAYGADAPGSSVRTMLVTLVAFLDGKPIPTFPENAP
jgi:hypothetical protein